jgi:flagellar basal-body rod modification protein FlgD
MSTTNPITGAAAAAGITGVPANMQISQTGFLKLITTQLQAQNPLQPTDPTQFLAQIEGMSEVSSMQSMQSSLQSSQVLSGASLLGRSVLAPGSTAALASGGTVSGAVTAPDGTKSLLVTIEDADGQAVKSFSVDPQAQGFTTFTWDGTKSDGTPAAAGQYTVKVAASVGGSSQPVDALIASKVSSVTIDPATRALDLDTDNGSVALSDVVSIL